jgi:hypothetical protein
MLRRIFDGFSNRRKRLEWASDLDDLITGPLPEYAAARQLQIRHAHGSEFKRVMPSFQSSSRSAAHSLVFLAEIAEIAGMNDDERNLLIKKAEKLAQSFIESVKSKKPCTVILTTDGERYKLVDSVYPLPDEYLSAWHADSGKYDINLSL